MRSACCSNAVREGSIKTQTRKVLIECDVCAQMMDALVGRTTLPWEDESSNQYLPAMRRLGAMRRGVLGMLHRDPAQRMQLTEVHSLWNSIFEGTVVV